ncbi:MAG: TylF/MycF/NovP-related O-methyltransferase [Patescibacteria group bacterium]
MKKIIFWVMGNEKVVLVFSFLRYYISWFFDKNSERRLFFEKIQPYTMVSYKRLSHLWDIVSELERKKIKGNYVECGVWKGGSAAIMAYLAQKHNSDRQIHLFDSFEGMPEPTVIDGERAAIFSGGKTSGKQKAIGKTVGVIEEAKKLFFSELELDKKNIVFHKGWFQSTIPANKELIGKIAVLRIDADWYESVKVCLEELYNQVIPGGYIIFDDYGFWPGCKKAVKEFFQKRKINSRLQKIDISGTFFRK